MSKGNPLHQLAAVPKIRPGDGPVVDVVFHSVASVNGLTVQSMGIDAGSAPVPDRKYLADVCDIRHDNGVIRLLFGQQRIGKSELRSLLVIQMSPLAIVRFLSTLDQLDPPIDEVAKTAGWVSSGGFAVTEEPAQTIALAASMVMIAIADDSACLDFFQLSPFALAAAAHTKKLAMDPVVRVDIGAGLMLFMLKELRKIATNLPKLPDLGMPAGNAT